MPGTCSTCRWWEARGPRYAGDRRANLTGQCERVDSLPDLEHDPDHLFAVDASATDDSGLRADLITGRAFGCIHHSQKGGE